jgi:hypothetical protein
MGLFAKNKKDPLDDVARKLERATKIGGIGLGKDGKEQLGGLMGSVINDVQLAQQLAAKEMAGTGVSADQQAAAIQAASAPGAMEQLLATRTRIERLNAHGVDAPATLQAVTIGATSPMSFGPEVTFDWLVEPAGGAPYAARSVDTVHPDAVSGLVAGARCTVRVDPGDPQTVMFWGTAAGATSAPTAAPPAGDDRIARLTKLQELRTAGLISDAEFDERKSQILAG